MFKVDLEFDEIKYKRTEEKKWLQLLGIQLV